MIVQTFKTNQTLLNGLVVVVSILLWIPGFFYTTNLTGQNYSNLKILNEWFENHKVINIIFTSVLVGFQGVFLNYLVNQEKLIKGNTHLTGLFYVLLNGACHVFFGFNEIIVLNTFIILVLMYFFKLYALKNANSILFNCGLLVGLGTLVYAPIICMFPLVLFVLSYLRPPLFKDYLIAIFGFITPFIYLCAYLYLYDLVFETHMLDWLFIKEIFIYQVLEQPYLYYIIIYLGFVILAISSLFSQLSRDVVKDRKQFVVVLLLFVFIGYTMFFNKTGYNSIYILSTIPSSILLANYFNKLKKAWLAELFFIIICLGIVGGYFL